MQFFNEIIGKYQQQWTKEKKIKFALICDFILIILKKRQINNSTEHFFSQRKKILIKNIFLYITIVFWVFIENILAEINQNLVFVIFCTKF